MKIKRPTVTIIKNRSGSTTYQVTCEHWNKTYQRVGWNPIREATEELAAGFKKRFDREAKAIETGTSKDQRFIMKAYVDSGAFLVLDKIPEQEELF